MALYKIANVGEVAVGEMIRVEADELDLALFLLEDGYYVTSDICTHAVASLTDGTLTGDVIMCPKHGGQFNVKSGAAVHFPAFSPIATYPVHVDGDEIFVEIED